VNEYEAHSTGGKFILRFDDNQLYWRLIKPGVSDTVKKSIMEDLEWMGVKVDQYSSQSDLHERTEQILNEFGYKKQGILYYAGTHIYLPDNQGRPVYPYVPDYTAEKVIHDFLDGISLLIRGEDLLTEFSLYNYFGQSWDLIIPRQVFLPRLRCSEGELTDVSKTKGNHRISDCRKSGMTPEDIMGLLRSACLKDVLGSWAISNIKKDIVL
jgi:glutamyl/glutaminyl-tRNA synthetase